MKRKNNLNETNQSDLMPQKPKNDFEAKDMIFQRSGSGHSEIKSIAMSIVLIAAISLAASIDQRVQAQQRQDVNWEQLCIQYGGLVGIHTPCSELAHGTFLTEHGKTALACLFSGGTLILLGVDPTTVSMIGKVAREVCP